MCNKKKVILTTESKSTNFSSEVETEVVIEDPNTINYWRPYLFIAVDEVGKEGFLVRRIYDLSIESSAKLFIDMIDELKLSPEQINMELYPEKYGMSARAPGQYTIRPAEHALGNIRLSNTPYISASSIFPEGAMAFDGRPIYLDVAKMKAAGVKIISSAEIIADLNIYKTQYPHTATRVDKLIKAITNIEGEVLVHGNRVPASAVFTPQALNDVSTGIKIVRSLRFFGYAFTAYDLNIATKESIAIKSVKPVTAEVIRQVGGWSGALLGAEYGLVGGALLGVETGPGAIVTGVVGGIIGGIAGYYGADWIADMIYEN